MKIFLSIFVFYFSMSAHANNTTAQQNLRTLFTTASERAQLDKLRAEGKFNEKQLSTTVTKIKKPITVKLQGVVLRKKHKPVVFINDSNNLKSNRINTGITIKPRINIRKNYTVPISVNQNRIKLKPGQQWSEVDKTIKDSYRINKHNVKAKNEATTPNLVTPVIPIEH